MTGQASEAAKTIAGELSTAGIRLVASLPDNWISELIDEVDADDRFVHVRVNREESAVGLCSGAYFGGVPAVALMGASGFMTCVYAITKINFTYQIPLFLITTLRGSIGDPAAHHVSNGLYLEPTFRALRIPYLVVDRREQIGRISESYRHSRIMNRPTVVALTRSVLRGEA